MYKNLFMNKCYPWHLHSVPKAMFTGQLLNKTTKHIFTAVMHDRNGNLFVFFSLQVKILAGAFGAISSLLFRIDI